MKPARKQVDESVLKVGPDRAPPSDRTGTFYNIWYNKWTGGDRIPRAEKAKTRCNVLLDSGLTKGDKMSGAYFCLYFARGCCPFGYECNHWHRIPTESDRVETTIDAFGRDKFDEYREDMGGVGSFNRENRTLYVGHVHVGPDMEDIVRKHFNDWGEIEKIKILKDKGVAFVTYKSSLNAEFAKEAMSNQSLDHSEILNVRWATDDPNPRAKAEYKRKAEEMTAQALQKHLPAEFTLAGYEYENKRPRISENTDPEDCGSQDYQASQDTAENSEEHQAGKSQPQTSNFVIPKQKDAILSQETLETLKSFSMIKRSSLANQEKQNIGKVDALGGLADYGSDEEDTSDKQQEQSDE